MSVGNPVPTSMEISVPEWLDEFSAGLMLTLKLTTGDVPSVFVAVMPTMKNPASVAAPEIAPVVVFKVIPAGNAEDAQDVGIPVAQGWKVHA